MAMCNVTPSTGSGVDVTPSAVRFRGNDAGVGDVAEADQPRDRVPLRRARRRAPDGSCPHLRLR